MNVPTPDIDTKTLGFSLASSMALANNFVVWIRLSITSFLKSSFHLLNGFRTFSPATFTTTVVCSGSPVFDTSSYIHTWWIIVIIRVSLKKRRWITSAEHFLHGRRNWNLFGKHFHHREYIIWIYEYLTHVIRFSPDFLDSIITWNPSFCNKRFKVEPMKPVPPPKC